MLEKKNAGINIAISTIYASILKKCDFFLIMRFSSQTIFNEELFISMSRLHLNGNSAHVVYVRYQHHLNQRHCQSQRCPYLTQWYIVSTISAACSTPFSKALVIHAS